MLGKGVDYIPIASMTTGKARVVRPHARCALKEGGEQSADGEGGEHVHGLDLLDLEDGEGDADQKKPAHGADLVHHHGGHELPNLGGEERQGALVDEHGQGGEEDAGAQGGPQGEGPDAVHDGLGQEEAWEAARPLLDGRQDGHGPDAEEERRGHESLGEPLVLRAEDALGPFAEAGHPLVEVQKLPGQGPDDLLECLNYKFWTFGQPLGY